VRALGFNPRLTSFPRVAGLRGIVILSDGSRITADQPRLESERKLALHALCGVNLEIPTEELVSWQTLGGKAVYLSDLEPQDYQFTPYLALRWPLRRDQNALGGVLSIRNRDFAKGLGMHSQSAVSYPLDSKFVRFQSIVGIDDATQGKGSVIFRVLADGKQIFASPVVRGNQPPLAISLAVADVKTLTLVVDFADFGDVQDHADWCDAMLIK